MPSAPFSLRHAPFAHCSLLPSALCDLPLPSAECFAPLKHTDSSNQGEKYTTAHLTTYDNNKL